MPRKPFVQNPNSIYHITGRCINKEWFVSISSTWCIFEDYLFMLSHFYNVRIRAFILMDNHFHLLARFPRGNLSEAMAYFLRETSRVMTKSSGRINRTWGGRFHRSEIDSLHYFNHAYKYLYRNPVEAVLCENVEFYPYSSLQGLLGIRRLAFPVFDDGLTGDPSKWLQWLNRKPSEASFKALKSALRKQKFELPRDRVTRARNHLEYDAY